MPSATPYLPERGDIFWLVLDPRTGHEQSGRRPVIAVSSKQFSQHTSLAVVCPITSKVKGLPYEISLVATKTKGAILPIHLRSVDVVARKAVFIEKAPAELLAMLQQYVSAIIDT
jgi:mRNA interferase MazF